jgi:hypothetical protein
MFAAPFLAVSGILKSDSTSQNFKEKKMKIIDQIKPLGFTWETADPFFILCSPRRQISPREQRDGS